MVQNDASYDLLAKHIVVYKAEYRNFQSVFGISVKPYWNNLLGFDIVKFDTEFIKAPDGISAEEAIQEKYGDEGVRICKALLGMEVTDEH